MTPAWDDVQKNPHVTIDGGSTWIGFDNARSFIEKAKYVRDNELGGAVIWALDLDDFNGRSALFLSDESKSSKIMMLHMNS